MTVEGERQLRAEFAAEDREQNRRPLQLLDQRIADISASIDSAEVVLPPDILDGTIHFGATVRVRDSDGEELAYRIVGVDETDFDRGWVSWLSPIGKALMNHSEGDLVRFKFPAGEKDLTILAVAYE